MIPWNLTLALQSEDNGAQEQETQEYYDPVAAAADAWGDDGSQPVRYDPIAAATESWGDDGTQPVHYDPVEVAQEGGGDDEKQADHSEPVAEAQEGWGDDGSQPATEEETPASEEAEEESVQAITPMDDEEGQVTKKRGQSGEMHLHRDGGCI